ncbi:MAG: putative iron-sulfur cluster-binding metallochaperone [Ardenticatenaceae bacterium]
MTNCCTLEDYSTPTTASFIASSVEHCPQCGRKGKPIAIQTVKAMLAISLERLRPTPYHFCRTPDCSVVYFAADGGQLILERHLRERVHQKAPHDEAVFVCYCFRYTPGSIRAEFIETGESAVVARVNAGIQAGQCACEIRNPQGSCCLGNIHSVVKRIATELQLAPTTDRNASNGTKLFGA